MLYVPCGWLQVADPNNVFQLRDVATISNYFIIGNGCGDIYKVQNVPHGTLIKEWYDSPTLGGEQRRMTIYLPAGYNKIRIHIRYFICYTVPVGMKMPGVNWEG